MRVASAVLLMATLQMSGCAGVGAAESGAADLCEIMRAPDAMRGRSVQVSAFMVRSFEFSAIEDVRCPGSAFPISLGEVANEGGFTDAWWRSNVDSNVRLQVNVEGTVLGPDQATPYWRLEIRSMDSYELVVE